jgi:hypothetical protein
MNVQTMYTIPSLFVNRCAAAVMVFRSWLATLQQQKSQSTRPRQQPVHMLVLGTSKVVS